MHGPKGSDGRSILSCLPSMYKCVLALIALGNGIAAISRIKTELCPQCFGLHILLCHEGFPAFMDFAQRHKTTAVRGEHLV